MKEAKTVTIEDVANAAGVSKSTVSQFLNKRYEYMSKSTREKIEKVVEELQFQPNHFARNLKSRKTKMVGIIVANIRHVFSTEIIRIVEQSLQEQGIHVIICNADDNPEKEVAYINLLAARNVDGLIIFPTGANYSEYSRLIDNKIPVVFIDRKIEGILADTVMLDNEAASFLAVSTLVKSNRDRIAMLTLPLTNNLSPRLERIEGYKKALSFFKIDYREELVSACPLINIKEELTRLFESDIKPNGIIAGNDLILKEALSFLKEQKISIPDEVAIIGIDDVSYADIYHPALTTIAQPTKEMGLKAAEIILERIKENTQKVPVVYRFSPELKIRESC
ncbi:substrate-binding domain-containing protein [Neobacillus sp. YIM B02564]|uniref:Substrate-binding domain-containing protein n=1 Tax=Neobacillus paridis TaxID=2803862 RepID=A0ABS1TTU2_9BACI|nr:substrate-binding domain-containing protein [Neobacillus paridis]MBL4954730.1 substrate-binding domain-containing protein [Neobacillus paridis]